MTVFAKTAAGLYIGRGEVAAIEARRDNGCWVLNKCSITSLLVNRRRTGLIHKTLTKGSRTGRFRSYRHNG